MECKEEEILKGEVHNICNCFCIVINAYFGVVAGIISMVEIGR